MRAIRGLMLATLAVAALMTPTTLLAQSCGTGNSVVAVGGYVTHKVAGGTAGAQVGGDVGLAVGPAALRLGVRGMLLEGTAPDPVAGRVRFSYPVAALEGVAICADAHAGVSVFSAGGDGAVATAGGLGLTLEPARSDGFHPWLSVRGLGGWTTGTVLDVGLNATGLGVGVEAGFSAMLGPVVVRASAARDGFDGGLGATPFPETSLELGLGFRF